ncbi:YcaO-related McrA-glycine thioamidation protein [Methanobacterium sp. ACI-7]|uniref:YcaO-related McrA-glycine thioamidation protein n=1 Tax=unclassified Methanobacterium TaxID=2627676 RepID=UPI0039C319FB
MFKEVPVKYSGCTHRAINPEETIRRVKGKLKTAGVTRIAEITHLDRVGIPVYSAIRPSAAEGAVSIYAGKGATKDQAKASAMMEAFERYSAEPHEHHVNTNALCGFFDEIGKCINPESLILPKLPFNPQEKELKWIKAINIKDDNEYLIPADSVFHPYVSENVNLFKSNTNGLASGNEIEEAIFHGMTEVIERDAWSLFEAKRKDAPQINLENIDNLLISEIVEKFKEAGIDIKVIDLTSDVEMPTIAAVSDDTILKDPALLTLGVGTHLDPEIAVLRALTEVAQSRATQIHGTREDTTRAVFMRKAGYERMKRINKHWFGESSEIIELDQIKNRSGKSFKDDIETSMILLKKAGFEDALFVDLTRPEIEIPVVRAIIPGMEVYSVDPDRIGKRLVKQSKRC